MGRYDPPIPKLGIFETMVAFHHVTKGEWHPDYRAALRRLGIDRPPEHLFHEIRVMRARKAAGDENWRDGTRKPRT